MKRNPFIFSLIVTALFIVLQSTLLQKFSVYGVIPDIALILIVFSANSLGTMKGQALGFGAGLIQDILSSGPLGFNALIRTVTGFIYGKFKGKLFLDSILMPVLFIVIASFLKELMTMVIGFLFLPEGTISYFTREFFIELGLNSFLSPFIFALMKLTGLYRINNKDGF